MTPAASTLSVEFTRDLAAQWEWFLVLGAAMLLLGLVAVWRSVVATVASMEFFGALLLLAAGIEITAAVWVSHWAGFFDHALAAILFGVLGLMFVMTPEVAAGVLTFVMALAFLVSGLFHITSAVVLLYSGWGWQVLDGLVTFALGVMIFAEWPASGHWAIGLFLGFDLAFYGATWIAIAWRLRGA